jgi:NADH-quinone oxidoreductase subunit J
MTFIHFIFYVFSAAAIASGMVVVVSHHPVRSVLALVLAFFAMSGVWLILGAEFLALILVLVYVGAVMTLFLFVVMMLRANSVDVRQGFVRYLPFAALLVLLLLGLILTTIVPKYAALPPPAPLPADYNNLADLGMVLYTQYAWPFEIAAVLLLAAIVAAISLAHRRPQGRKVQNITGQIAVKRSDRIRLLSVPSEPKNGEKT